jgi:hypothetical protein
MTAVISCKTEREALRRASSLFDAFGPDADIEIYLNELSGSGLLYSKEWMRQWHERHGKER